MTIKNMTMVGVSFLFAIGSLIAAKRSNIIFIMSDDHTSQAIGAYGSRLAKLNPTPTIDQLAEEGMLFENAFCSNAICAPSRATILTGQYAHTCGVHDLRGSIEPGGQYLAKEMKKAGYQTAMIGKWHLKREDNEDLGGHFSLNWKKIDNKWLIISDHSS